MKNVLEYLEISAMKFPDKVVFADEKESIKYENAEQFAKKIGTFLSRWIEGKNNPVAVLMNKTALSLVSFMGVIYSGNFYVVIDSKMPTERINKIFESLLPSALLTDYEHSDIAEKLNFCGEILFVENAIKEPEDNELLLDKRRKMIDTDPVYALFTSGSTGVPKGAVISHKSVISYTEWFTDAFGINESTLFGSQTPFYFSMSVSDIFGTIKSGATLQIIPKFLFSFPLKLVEFLNEKKINTIYWVPSALCIVANLNVFKYVQPLFLQKILFAGEIMPTKQLNYWISYFPDALFANLFGPTETTDICTYYVINREFADDESLPIGYACNNCDILVLKENGTEASLSEEGELYVRGSFLSNGYYADFEKTEQSFIQNPLNKYYPEIIYKTGDLVRYNKYGELVYISRKDFQIKHMGYRIELGEIETAVNALSNVIACACVYDEVKDKIVLVYQSQVSDNASVLSEIKGKLPPYMMPNLLVRTKIMPHNQNGKIDRSWLKNNYKTIDNENIKK